MDASLQFRRTLCTRILFLLGAAALTTACGTSVDTGSGGGHGGSGQGGNGHGGASTGSSIPSSECFKPSPTPATCPPSTDASLTQELADPCGSNGSFFVSGQVNMTPDKQGRCCYDVGCGLGTGRPFVVDDAPLTADAAPKSGWDERGLAPAVAALSPAERRALADAWARDALLEHASIASFGRFALELLGFGAPAELVEEAHRAAIDEARHARLCFELATAYAGERVGPSPFPFGGVVAIAADLVAFARAVVREGCVGETIAAVIASEQLEHATDPAARQALTIIAADEARHAELAWRTVAWAIATGGDPVREAVRDELARSASSWAEPLDGPHAPAYGRLGAPAASAAAARALAQVVAPCAAALA